MLILLQARELVLQSDGLEQTRALAQGYVDQAISAIKDFPESAAKDGLVEMCTKVMQRRK
jgi:hexaprenyl-diphosphate synthase